MTFDRDGFKTLMTEFFAQELTAAGYENSDTLLSSMQNLLFTAIAEGLAESATYSEYLARETKWDTAQNRSSIVKEINFRGYKVQRTSGAEGGVIVAGSISPNMFGQYLCTAPAWSTLATYAINSRVVYDTDMTGTDPFYRVYQAAVAINTPSLSPDTHPALWTELTAPAHAGVFIPAWTKFKSADGKYYTSYEDALLPYSLTGRGYIEVPVVQGIPNTTQTSALGQAFETITISNPNIDNTHYQVKVNGVVWTEVADIYSAQENEEAYSVQTAEDQTSITIKFGNGRFGKRLAATSNVQITWVETSGVDGNALARGSVSIVEGNFQDGSMSPVMVTLSCSNFSSISGGAAGDTISSIKTNAVTSFQTQERCITYDDYKAMLLKHPLIEKCIIWGAYEYIRDSNWPLETPIPSIDNCIYVSALTPSAEKLTVPQKSVILNYLLPYKPPTDLIKFVDPNTVGLIFNISAFANDRSKSLSMIKSDIVSYLTSNYSISARNFGDKLYDTVWKGQVHSASSAILYHTSYLELSETEHFPTAGVWYLSTTLKYDNIAEEVDHEPSTHVWLRVGGDTSDWVKVATADASTGVFAAESSYPDILADVMNKITYETGSVSIGFNESSALLSGVTTSDVEVRIRYRLESLDVVSASRSVLTILEEANVTVAYVD